MRSQHFSNATSTRKEQEEMNMKDQPQNNPSEADALFLVTVRIKKVKRIEQVMNDKDKERTGLMRLSRKELANLNAWLDTYEGLSADPMFT